MGKYDQVNNVPHDPVAEWFLLCCLLCKPQLIRGVRSELFHIEECRRVLLKMQQFLVEQRECLSDPALFLHEIGRALEKHYHEPLSNAFNQLPSPENWTYWMDILVANWKSRRLLMLAPRLNEASFELQQGNVVPVEGIRRELVEIESESSGVSAGRNVGQVAIEAVNQLEDAYKRGGAIPGISTGLKNLDRASQGMQKGRFYIFAGRPGEGKSSLCLAIATSAAMSGKKVIYFSLEMPSEELVLRMISSHSRVVLGKFQRGTASQEDFDAVGRSVVAIKNLPFTIIDSVSSLHRMIHLLSVECSRSACDLVVVDYIQRVRIPGFKGNRNDLVTEISNAMKDFSLTFNVPVIAAAQLNRAVTRDDRHPNLADLRDSGALEQDADLVGLLHSENDTETKMLVAKNRSGETGVINFTFRRELTRFECPI